MHLFRVPLAVVPAYVLPSNLLAMASRSGLRAATPSALRPATYPALAPATHLLREMGPQPTHPPLKRGAIRKIVVGKTPGGRDAGG